MLSLREILWHFVRLALAAALLAYDIRYFLFYAFTILLICLFQLDRLWALIRVYQILNEHKINLLLRRADFADTEVAKEVAKFIQEGMDRMPERDRKHLERDFAKVVNR